MSRQARRRCTTVVALVIALLSCVFGASAASAALSTRALGQGDPALTPTDLAQTLAGAGVTVSGVTYAGATQPESTVQPAAGTFAGGDGIVGFNDGVVLSSGNIASVGPNNSETGTSTGHGAAGDASLDALDPNNPTSDASVLEFDLVPNEGRLTFNYVFTSEEYNEFVGSSFNDVFAFFVNGSNCALVPGSGQQVSINTINNGNPFGNTDPEAGAVASNPALYRNNDTGALDTAMDGLTTVLTCSADVTPNQPNRIKLAIADRGDDGLDSNVLLQKGSFSSGPADGDGDGVPDSGDACPTLAASTANGCPPPPPDDAGDGDGDGVPNSRDACPTTKADTVDGCPLPEPVLGQSYNVEPLRGEVFVSLPGPAPRPGASSSQALISGALGGPVIPGLKGRTFVPLSEARQAPFGSLLDTRKGTVQISSARNAAGQLQSGSFLAGVFQVLQSRKRSARGVTELRLKGSSFRPCQRLARAERLARRRAQRRRARRRADRRRARGSAPAFASASRRIRRVRSNSNGRFRTRGRHSSATVRGTVWETTDRCDGTLTKVTRGVVAVRDFRRKKTITVRAGKSYLAKAPR